MPEFLQDNLIWIIVALIVAVALFFLLRRSGGGGGKSHLADSAHSDSSATTGAAAAAAGGYTGASEAVEDAAKRTDAGADAAPGAKITGKPDIAPPEGGPNELTLMKGVGPKLKALLTELNVTRFDQIAAWEARDVAEVDRYLGRFSGRIERDGWVDQAALLARGDREGFEAKYGALGGEIR